MKDYQILWLKPPLVGGRDKVHEKWNEVLKAENLANAKSKAAIAHPGWPIQSVVPYMHGDWS